MSVKILRKATKSREGKENIKHSVVLKDLRKGGEK